MTFIGTDQLHIKSLAQDLMQIITLKQEGPQLYYSRLLMIGICQHEVEQGFLYGLQSRFFLFLLRLLFLMIIWPSYSKSPFSSHYIKHFNILFNNLANGKPEQQYYYLLTC